MSEALTQLAAVRALREAQELKGAQARTQLVAALDTWLATIFAEAAMPEHGYALVAVGSLGRREASFGSDLDLVLLHSVDSADLAEIADRVWYPIWDSGLSLDHSVRTVGQTLAVADDDLKAVLGLLDIRHLAGDASLTASVRSQIFARWRANADRRLLELRDSCVDRGERFGELAFLLEPDLKESRGGIRDVHALNAIAAAQKADAPRDSVARARDFLLDVRAELHRLLGGRGRPSDRLRLQDQDAVAAALRLADADALMAQVSMAARTISFALDETWRAVLPLKKAGGFGLFGRREPQREPLALGVVEQNGEVVLARHADPDTDPTLVFRAAAAAARSGLPLAPITRQRLAAIKNLPVPWPGPTLDSFLTLLGAGHDAIPVFEALDQSEILVQHLPEWANVRSKPQRNAFHRFTVDRHLLETAANAAALTRTVARPDLLLLGALLHDIGKGRPGDHTEVGIVLVAEIAHHMGLAEDDTEVLQQMVRHHLLLPDVATRRDIEDPITAMAVARAVGNKQTLELLHALAQADGLATGPAAWSEWKAGLIASLVRRTAAILETGVPLPARELTAAQRELVEAGEFAVVADLDGIEDTVTVIYADAPGVLASLAGVLALHRIDIRSLDAFTEGDVGLATIRIALRDARKPDWTLVREDLRKALAGGVDLGASLAVRAAAYPQVASVAPATAVWVEGASSRSSVLEVRCPDAVGLLFRTASALTDSGLNVVSAFCTTLGAEVVDTFYVTMAGNGLVEDAKVRERVCSQVIAAVAGAHAA